jgi:hypothetical protein
VSYPQPNPDSYAVGGYNFFRLNTLLTCDGDIYESTQGAQGFAIGPDSDISKVNLAYFDDEVASTFQNQISVSIDRPFAGFFPARNEADYAPASRPGRILMWPDELYNSSFRPAGFTNNNGTRFDTIVPVLDVVEFFAPAQLTPQRNDKNYRILNIPFGTVSYIFMFPTYGRRLVDFSILNGTGSAAAAIHYSVHGVRYSYRTNVTLGTADVQLIASTAVANNAAVHGQVTAATLGFWDAMYVTISSDSAPAIPALNQVAINIRVSDRQV